MWRSFWLLIPALVPSWRFFDAIAPSPRIEVRWQASSGGGSGVWQEFRPRPTQLGGLTMVKRLFWNPDWNESLFLVSCAERLMEAPTAHSTREILMRILSDGPGEAATHVQFRLVFVRREGAELIREVTYISPVFDRMGAVA